MSAPIPKREAVLMIAYTYYQSDPRVIREAEAAVEGGFEVDFLALRRPGEAPEEDIRGVRLIRLAQSKYRGRGRLRYLASYLEFFVRCFLWCTASVWRRGYVAIHVNNMPDFLVFSTVAARLRGARIILDIHDPMPNTFASKFRVGAKGWMYQLLLWEERVSAWYCHRVLTVHEPVRDGILLDHGMKAQDVDVISNFPDEEVFQVREKYHVDSVIRLVFHGTILERSGLRLLVLALAKVKQKDRLKCRIIGEGDFSDSLREMVQSLGLESVVEFDNRSYPVRQIPGLLADCHVGVIPLEISSVTDYALPLKLLEYVAMGLPVISVRSHAICHYLKEGDCLFYDWNELDALAAAMDELIAHPERLYELRARSLSNREKWLWGREKQKYIKLLLELGTSRRLTGRKAWQTA